MKLGCTAKAALVGLIVIGYLTILGFSSAPETPRTINIVAKRFTYEPNDITVKKDEPVVLKLTSRDVTHGLKFADLNLNTTIAKGKESELAFTPTKTGDFNGQCSVYCGSGHPNMRLTLHVTE